MILVVCAAFLFLYRKSPAFHAVLPNCSKKFLGPSTSFSKHSRWFQTSFIVGRNYEGSLFIALLTTPGFCRRMIGRELSKGRSARVVEKTCKAIP